MGTVPMFAPDGSIGDVPQEKVTSAIKAGFKVGIDMLSPDGKHGTVPQEKMLDAAAAGFRPVAPVNLPKGMGPSYVSPGVKDLPSRIAEMTSQQKQRLSEGQSLTGVGEILGSIATGGLLPAASGIAGLAGRAALSGAGVGAGAIAGGAGPKEAAEAAATGAIMQPMAEGASALAKNVAPKIAESALNITDKMRGRGRTIGDAVLAETHGITPSTLAPEIRKAIGTITQQMEQGVDAATQAGVTGSAQPAQQVLNDAISNLPRNARNVAAKLNSLRDLLDLGGGPQASYTPTELLEMKRGIGKEMSTWPAEWQKLGDVQAVKQQLYGAIDGELDRLVPGNAEKNQVISSLIPAKQQATRISGGASIAQRMAHRLAAHTGALAASGIGGAVGYEHGGTPGAVAGATAGLVLPEMMSSSTGQMLAARLLNALGEQATSPQVLPLVKALAAQAAQPSNPELPFHPGAGITR